MPGVRGPGDPGVHLARAPVGSYLYGRGMYETMVYWETAGVGQPPVARDFAQMWREATKVVYSRALEAVSSDRTRIERNFETEAVRRMKAEASRDMTVGGPDLAGQALAAGLVDEMFVVPIVVGGGKPSLPSSVRLKLELLEERRFGNGTVYLRYRCLG
jgi:dihydrofolate reductase